jgi:hypothetical protein
MRAELSYDSPGHCLFEQRASRAHERGGEWLGERYKRRLMSARLGVADTGEDNPNAPVEFVPANQAAKELGVAHCANSNDDGARYGGTK